MKGDLAQDGEKSKDKVPTSVTKRPTKVCAHGDDSTDCNITIVASPSFP